MKKTLLTLSFFTFATLFTACSTVPVTDKLAVVGNPSLSSNPCAAIDQKVLKLDRFTEVVKHTSAFHLEEKANAIPTPGITVSNNRKQMLKDAEKKYAEYAAEYQKHGCKTPMRTDRLKVAEETTVTSSLATVTASEPVKPDETMLQEKSSSVTTVESSKAAPV